MPTKEWKLNGEVRLVGRNDTTKMAAGEDGKEHPVDSKGVKVVIRDKDGNKVTLETGPNRKPPVDAGEDVTVVIRYGAQSRLG